MKVYIVNKTDYDSDFTYVDRVFTTRERAKQYCDDERARIDAEWDADYRKRSEAHSAAMLAWHKKLADTNGKAMIFAPSMGCSSVERYYFEFDEYELED